MSIRSLNIPEEVSNLSKLEQENYPNDYFDEKDFVKIVSSNPVWVYEEEGQIIGWLVSEISKGTPYIWTVATISSHRGKGIATALIKEFEKHYSSKGYEKAWLHTRVENPAQKLYFDLGYRVASFVPHIYGMGSHGITMRKKLN